MFVEVVSVELRDSELFYLRIGLENMDNLIYDLIFLLLIEIRILLCN